MQKSRLDKQELAASGIEAATYVLRQLTRYRPSVGQLQIVPSQFSTHDLTVVTRFSGDLSGQFYLSLDESSAIGICKAMLQRPVDTIGKLEISALSELGNMVSETATALMEEQGAVCYPTWAAVLRGQEERLTPLALPGLVVPIRTTLGDLNMHIVLETYAPFSWASPAQRTGTISTVTVSGRAVQNAEDSLSLAA